ncbi:hypothetical protein P5673_012305, partial [Acropora cervicornis]
MREIKNLKHSDPHKFKRKANEDQYKFNLKLGETLDKSQWEPIQIITWLGVILNPIDGSIKATDERIATLSRDLENLPTGQNPTRVHVKRVASVAGQIISLSSCVGPVARIMTRFLFSVISSAVSWDCEVLLTQNAISEIDFWRHNVHALNGKITFPDSSDSACGAFVQLQPGVELVSHQNWSIAETTRSSTWRELKAKLFCAPFVSSDVFCSGFWRDQVTPGNSFVQGLTDRLKSTVLSSKAYSTSSQYHRAFRKWKEFAVCKLNETGFPADPFHVALYLQHLLEQAQSPSVIDSAFYGIKWAHDMAGLPSPTDNSVVENVRSAAKRILGTAAVNRKEPISSDMIREIVIQVNLDNPVDLRNITMYVLCFTGFFKFDDISRVRRSDIAFHEGFMVIQVQK